MDEDADQGTDAASIKPVSSLKSHFEGLNIRRPSHGDYGVEKEHAKPLKPPERPQDGPRSSGLRASFDVSRTESPWDKTRDSGLPGTPGSATLRAVSPPKSDQRRPVSMLAQSSPQLTPSVNVDPPKSPPKGYFFNRSSSRSPDRSMDNTPLGKVRELISQASSRSSSRPGTPQPEELNSEEKSRRPSSPTTKGLPKAQNAPPLVNRAEKPKIPAKPSTFTVQDISGISNQHRRPSMDARVSPFSTPPSSDEEQPAEQTSRVPSLTHQPHAQLHSAQGRKPSFKDDRGAITNEPPVRPGDPRFLGFSKTHTAAGKSDSRPPTVPMAPPRPPSRDSVVPPTRANTVSERPLPRDPREFSLPNAKSSPRHVSENIRATPPPFELSPSGHASKASARDARFFGFSSAPNRPLQESIAESPSRDHGAYPPPRPSEESKRSQSRQRYESPTSIDQRIKPTLAKIPSASTVNIVNESNPRVTKFPPPPKRAATSISEQPSIRTVPQTLSSNTDTAVTSYRTDEADSDEAESLLEDQSTQRTDYPDSSQANRRPPYFHKGPREISTITDTRTFDVCGQYLCTTGYVTRVFDLNSGENVMSLNHGQSATLKVLCVAFKPASTIDQEGSRIWIGNNTGDLQEIDIMTQTVIATSSAHSRRSILQILRHGKNLWTLDDDGKLFVWPAHEDGTPNLRYSHISHRVQKGHTFSLVVKDKLWLATGKEVRIYKPGDEANFAALTKPMQQPGTGEITSGAASSEREARVYFGHADGKVSVYSMKDFSCLGVIKVSDYKINGLAFVSDRLWAAYKTGKIYVYDTSTTPWKVNKDWRAHSGPISGLMVDPSSVWTMRQLHVASLGQDNLVKFWDGMLEDDWLEIAMNTRDVEYCSFRETRAAVATWNVGATNPHLLRADEFIADAIHAEDPPEILAFGLQEVVDLEDKGIATKGILGFAKKKEAPKPDQYQGGVYREWRDCLNKYVNRSTSSQYHYIELSTSHLIGLFQCVFVRQEEKMNVHNVSTTNIKCGLGGHYGNKGALVTRFILDDSTLCFVNAHLAAGQRQTSNRNNDIATILEDESLPAERDSTSRSTLYVGGGDGSQILDHEVCILNGDLNYRIDAIPRDTVINMIKRGEIPKLLERDQIYVSRRRVTGFRLSPFTELPITFLPTYKYDVNTDNYDTSEKKRAPAWCDRLLYRGPGRVKQIEYRRHDGAGLRVSDHRPVSGLFRIRVKKVDEKRRRKVWDGVETEWEQVKKKVVEQVCVDWLTDRFGLSIAEAKKLLIQK